MNPMRLYNALVAACYNAVNGVYSPIFWLINLLYRWGLKTAPALFVDALKATNLAGTYANGSSGVGATLTVTATGALVVDGVTITQGMTVLLAAQTTGAEKGLYSCTTPGATGVQPVLTRATLWDQSAEMINGSLFYIKSGTTYGGKVYAYTGATGPTVGVTDLTMAEDTLLRSTAAATITGSLDMSGGTLILPTAAAPAQTAEGSVVWDSDDNKLTVGDGASRKTLATAGLTATMAGATAAEGTGATGGTAPAFTGTAATSASAVHASGTGMTAAGQVMTSTDNQTIGINELAGMFLATATANSLLYIVSNAAAVGAPVAITCYGTPVTDAGAYVILRAPTPAGTVASHTHTGPSHTHATGTLSATQV